MKKPDYNLPKNQRLGQPKRKKPMTARRTPHMSFVVKHCVYIDVYDAA